MPRKALGGAVPCFVPRFGMKEFSRWYSDEWPASAAATTNEEVALRVVPSAPPFNNLKVASGLVRSTVPQAPTGPGYAERNTGGLAARPLAPSPMPMPLRVQLRGDLGESESLGGTVGCETR